LLVAHRLRRARQLRGLPASRARTDALRVKNGSTASKKLGDIVPAPPR
jgi:hypothetical protein